MPQAWRARLSDDPLSPNRTVIIRRFLPFALILGSPFGPAYLMNGQWLVGVSVLCAQCMMLVVWWRLRSGRGSSRLILALALCNNLIVVMSLHQQGAISMPWVSAALVANYFLIQRKRAHLLCLGMLIPAVLAVESAEGVRYALRLALSSLLLLAMLNLVLSALAQSQEHLKHLAEVDPLTGAGNKRRFDRLIANHVPPSQEHRTANALLAIDIDHFKSVNDGHGHAVGDEVLKEVAHRIRARLRESDQLFRVGGEEFAVILPRTGLNQALAVAEDIRMLFGQRAVFDGVCITVSIGLCEHRAGYSVSEWVEAADAALYAAKRRGRNRVVVS